MKYSKNIFIDNLIKRSNEIFYRIALARKRWQARNPTKPTFPTGHFHVARVQPDFDIIEFNNLKSIRGQRVKLEDNYRIAFFDSNFNFIDGYNSTRTIYNELSKLIKTVENTLINSLNNFNDLF